MPLLPPAYAVRLCFHIVCPFVCLSVCTDYNFWMLWHRNFIFGMVVHLDHAHEKHEKRNVSSEIYTFVLSWLRKTMGLTQTHTDEGVVLILKMCGTSKFSSQSPDVLELVAVLLILSNSQLHHLASIQCNQWDFLPIDMTRDSFHILDLDQWDQTYSYTPTPSAIQTQSSVINGNIFWYICQTDTSM